MQMINKEERRILQIFREQKKYGKNLAIVDVDTYRMNETMERWRLEDTIKILKEQINELEEINEKHQKLNGELREKIRNLEEIIDGKSIQELGTSNIYKED